MQLDFHYYCIAVLARAAGFNGADALAIAYASQYVDDSTESEQIPLKGEGVSFDPVRTAYAGLKIVGAVAWSAQKRVYIPFHFIPPRPFRPEAGERFSFMTRPAVGGAGAGPTFAEMLLAEAAREPLENHRRRLCRIGIALHTFADTWAHQGFSGRHNGEENDVENIHVFDPETGEWKHLVIENVVLDVLPQIGHAEAGPFPDLPFLRWRYDTRHSPPPVERDNTEIFLEAARAIYQALLEMDKRDPVEPIPWEELAPAVAELLGAPSPLPQIIEQMALPAEKRRGAMHLDERCRRWQERFDHLFRPYPPGDRYGYDRRRWRDEALEGNTDWDGWDQRMWAQVAPMGTRPDFWDSFWVHFHRAALRQRHFVLEHMP